LGSLSTISSAIQANLGLGFNQIKEKLDSMKGSVEMEFATRGALSALQSIESKVDSLLARPVLMPHHFAARSGCSRACHELKQVG